MLWSTYISFSTLQIPFVYTFIGWWSSECKFIEKSRQPWSLLLVQILAIVYKRNAIRCQSREPVLAVHLLLASEKAHGSERVALLLVHLDSCSQLSSTFSFSVSTLWYTRPCLDLFTKPFLRIYRPAPQTVLTVTPLCVFLIPSVSCRLWWTHHSYDYHLLVMGHLRSAPSPSWCCTLWSLLKIYGKR